MNQIIEELADEAGFVESWFSESGDDCEKEIKKFAKLIVDECIKQIIEKGTDWVDFAPSQTGVRPEVWAMAQHIKNHFGVNK